MAVEFAPRIQPRLRDDDSWRMAGCAERCRVYWVTVAGRSYAERMVSHDPAHHEAYGQNVLAREYRALNGQIVRTAELEIDGLAFEVRVHGCSVRLTAREAGILFYLASNLDGLCLRSEILRAVWGETYATQTVRVYSGKSCIGEHHLIRVHMARLRAKLGDARRLIETVPARGYRLRSEPPVVEPVRPRRGRPAGRAS